MMFRLWSVVVFLVVLCVTLTYLINLLLAHLWLIIGVLVVGVALYGLVRGLKLVGSSGRGLF